MARNFIILTTQRSGSTWLVDTVDSHHSIKAYTELFLSKGKGVPDWSNHTDLTYWNNFLARQSCEKKTANKTKLIGDYLDTLYKSPDTREQAVGFKLMYDQLKRNPSILPYLVKNRIALISLYRKNSVAAVVSNVLRGLRGVAHTTSENGAEHQPLFVDVHKVRKEVIWHYRKTLFARLVLRLIPNPKIEVEYQDLVTNPESLAAIFEFLGVDGDCRGSTLKKISRRPLQEQIQNYDELERTFRNTRYLPMLREIA